MTTPNYDIYAIKLASATRPAASNFLRSPDAEGCMEMDFIAWLISGHGRLVLVDTGFSRVQGRLRGRHLDRTPAEALRALGYDPEQVDTVVLTHLHYDHAGNIDEFPHARLVVQADELEYASGPSMAHPTLNHFFSVDDICHTITRVHRGNVDAPRGTFSIAPGLTTHLVGGHTRGLQVVEVSTERGTVILAADALHYFANFAQRNPFPAFVDLERLLEGYAELAARVPPATHLIPGHDPLVFGLFPAVPAPFSVAALHHRPRHGFDASE